MSSSTVIVGGSMAALRTAEALRSSGWAGTISVIGEEARLPYNRPPISKDLLAGRVDDASVSFPLRPSVADVEWRTGCRVVGLNVRERSVIIQGGERVKYGTLIIASGLRPRRVGESREGRPRFVLRTFSDALALRKRLVAGARVIILGSGFVGCEVAATAVEKGCHVTLVTSSRLPLRRAVGDELATLLRERHEHAGVHFVVDSGYEVADEDARIILSDGTVIDGDVLVEAIGSLPNSEWVDPLYLQPGAPITTDSAMRAIDIRGRAIEDVYAVGDIAAFPSFLDGGQPRAVEHWNIPGETAKRAAEVIAAKADGQDRFRSVLAKPFDPIPSFWTDQYDMHVLAYGLPALSDRCERWHDDGTGGSIFGFLRGDDLVGVCGVGMRSRLNQYRSHIGKRMSEVSVA